ncbi:hypothetical protein QUB47_03900 [Microcoleus sp. AT9_B5]
MKEGTTRILPVTAIASKSKKGKRLDLKNGLFVWVRLVFCDRSLDFLGGDICLF